MYDLSCSSFLIIISFFTLAKIYQKNNSLLWSKSYFYREKQKRKAACLQGTNKNRKGDWRTYGMAEISSLGWTEVNDNTLSLLLSLGIYQVHLCVSSFPSGTFKFWEIGETFLGINISLPLCTPLAPCTFLCKAQALLGALSLHLLLCCGLWHVMQGILGEALALQGCSSKLSAQFAAKC